MLFDQQSPRHAQAINMKPDDMEGFPHGHTSLLHDNIPNKPLITKAYDAFRKQNRDCKSDFMPTDDYLH